MKFYLKKNINTRIKTGNNLATSTIDLNRNSFTCVSYQQSAVHHSLIQAFAWCFFSQPKNCCLCLCCLSRICRVENPSFPMSKKKRAFRWVSAHAFSHALFLSLFAVIADFPDNFLRFCSRECCSGKSVLVSVCHRKASSTLDSRHVRGAAYEFFLTSKEALWSLCSAGGGSIGKV